MEVHHHPEVEKKTFKEYALEGLMIFIAVVMGFFAENIREWFSENHTERAYARLLWNDLKTDSSTLNSVMIVKNWRAGKCDSLITILKTGEFEQHSSTIYYLQSCLKINIPFRVHDATFQQLTNSGGFRFFRNTELYHEIVQYYSTFRFYRERETERTLETPRDLLSRIFKSEFIIADGKITQNLMDAPSFPQGNPQLLTSDLGVMNEYMLYVGMERDANSLARSVLQFQIMESLERTRSALQKEFHFQ